MMNKNNTNMTSKNMKEWMHKKSKNEAEEYAVIHKNINNNEIDDINENKLDKNTVAYVSDTRVSTKG